MVHHSRLQPGPGPGPRSDLPRLILILLLTFVFGGIGPIGGIQGVKAETLKETSNSKRVVCTVGGCVRGGGGGGGGGWTGGLEVGTLLKTPQTIIHLLPGTYDYESESSTGSTVGSYLPLPAPLTNSSLTPTPGETIYGTPMSDELVVDVFEGSWVGFPGLGGGESSSSSDDDGDSGQKKPINWARPIVVRGPSKPVLFQSDEYHGPLNLDYSNYAINTSNTPDESTQLDWQSIYLPPGVYLYYPPSPSYPAGHRNVIFRSSVPFKKALGLNLKGFDLRVGVGGAGTGGVFGSDACNPPCGPGGSCLPSSTSDSSSSFQCHCRPGFTGPTCLQCAPGHFGPQCQPCSEQCFAKGSSSGGRCDDGVEGMGGCLGSLGNSTDACGCLHGTCTSDQTCNCAAGWADGPQGKCSVCAPGFDLDHAGDCRACSLGTMTCANGKALTCSSGWTIDAATNRCMVSGGQSSCSDGQYWDGSACSRCSPACTSCTGPGADQCLECASPRFNLNGTCVGYDATNGICDSSTTRLEGVYVADNTKGRCEACPTGCLACAIPSFSITSIRNDTTCTACQEGWVLQNGQCVQECGAGFFFPEAAPSINGTCQACDTTKCSTCQTTATRCSSCVNSDEFATPAGECVSTCPSGTLPNNKLGRCIPCPADCATCTADGQCLTCPSTTPVLSRGRCSTVCPISTYWEDSLSSCAPCAGNCTSCTGRRDDQCVSCADGTIMKAGTCSPVSCNFITGLGICLRSDSSKEALWWPYLVVVLVLLTIGLTAVWWIRRSRRLRKENTAAFAATLDDTEVERRVAGIGGILRLLNTMRANEKSPVRESFFSPAVDGPPPAYTRKSSQPVFSITPPSPTAQGPARASFVKQGHDQLEAFTDKRQLPRQVAFGQGDSKHNSWAKDGKETPLDGKVDDTDSDKRYEHCMV